MKKLLFNLILSLIVLVFTGCKQDQSPAPLKFKAYEHNPILIPGEHGSWDESTLIGPQVYWFDSLYYMFYSGMNQSGKMSVGLAFSKNGIDFRKNEGNPILFPDGEGYDAWLAAGEILLQHDGVWTMYFGAGELIRYGPGQSIGRATAEKLTGPWTKGEEPILATGSFGEWDEGFIFPSSLTRLKDGTLGIYYTGGNDFQGELIIHTGLAVSSDGITWTKYDNPETRQHPFAESDPVMTATNITDWDSHGSWGPFVYESWEGYNMYYSGSRFKNHNQECAIGFAWSKDGIHWERFQGNPIFGIEDDPYLTNISERVIIEDSWLVFRDTICYMYYDYGVVVGKIGVAMVNVK
jgi:predicted GH43/DUF377 family glycosyl hydrolase